jgi:hypothetical protein
VLRGWAKRMGWGRGPGQRGRFVTLNFCEREGATAASRSWSRSELWNRAVVPSCGAELWKRAVEARGQAQVTHQARSRLTIYNRGGISSDRHPLALISSLLTPHGVMFPGHRYSRRDRTRVAVSLHVWFFHVQRVVTYRESDRRDRCRDYMFDNQCSNGDNPR